MGPKLITKKQNPNSQSTQSISLNDAIHIKKKKKDTAEKAEGKWQKAISTNDVTETVTNAYNLPNGRINLNESVQFLLICNYARLRFSGPFI